MNRRHMLLASGAGTLALQAQQPASTVGKTTLKVGDSAPVFTKLRSTMGGDPVSLSDFKGKNTVVLAFFPAAFTGG
jgi:peroxiredoxin